jgi:hypothetical protein
MFHVERRPDRMIEPSAVVRQAARMLAELYVALREQGFDDAQALMVVATMGQSMIGEREDG